MASAVAADLGNPKVLNPVDAKPKTLSFKEQVLDLLAHHVYVVNFRAKYKVKFLETIGESNDSVRTEAMEWCTKRGFKFISVHPKYIDLKSNKIDSNPIDEVE